MFARVTATIDVYSTIAMRFMIPMQVGGGFVGTRREFTRGHLQTKFGRSAQQFLVHSYYLWRGTVLYPHAVFHASTPTHSYVPTFHATSQLKAI